MNEKEKKEFEEVKLFYFYILLLINDNFIPVDNLNYIWTKIINFNLIPLKNYEDKDFYSQIDKLLQTRKYKEYNHLLQDYATDKEKNIN